jgi:ParB-like chromosome segregation protein Spo0J
MATATILFADYDFSTEDQAMPTDTSEILSLIRDAAEQMKAMPLKRQVETLNEARRILHEISPFKDEPVDFVEWVKNDKVTANDWNPNAVAPPEMELLRVSIQEDGYTQPIVAFDREDAMREVVDGFHRNRVGKECEDIKHRIKGYLPVVSINAGRQDKGDRIASTIRHNRARGKHKVDAMSDIVVELKRRNWSDEKICKELGMDQDEVLRLCQITGLAELFTDQQFSKSWDVEGVVTEDDFVELTDDVSKYSEEETSLFRTVNTSDEGRIFHTHDKWECAKAGFYATTKQGMTNAECEQAYKKLLTSKKDFEKALKRVITEWKHSCEHYLTNVAMNRIAWLGQAAVCLWTGVPASFRSGWQLLTEKEQAAADELALKYLNKWMKANKRPECTMEEARSGDRQSDIY